MRLKKGFLADSVIVTTTSEESVNAFSAFSMSILLRKGAVVGREMNRSNESPDCLRNLMACFQESISGEVSVARFEGREITFALYLSATSCSPRHH